MIVDAEGIALGRLCSYVAKQALLGNEVIVVNAEKAVISGDRDMVYRKELERLDIKNLGSPLRGPFHQRRADRYVRKAIRGMLPWHKFKGREAFKRVMVYIGVPADEIKRRQGVEFKESEIERFEELKGKVVGGVTVGELCKFIGGKC